MSKMIPWRKRPIEEAALFNPAFVAVVIQQVAAEYQLESNHPLPLELAFLAVPVLLVSNVRLLLPRKKNSSLAGWLQSNPEVRLNFAGMARSMVPVVREGILYGTRGGVLRLSGIGLEALPVRALNTIGERSSEVSEILRKANFVGRWYASAGTTDTVMILWGVQP